MLKRKKGNFRYLFDNKSGRFLGIYEHTNNGSYRRYN